MRRFEGQDISSVLTDGLETKVSHVGSLQYRALERLWTSRHEIASWSAVVCARAHAPLLGVNVVHSSMGKAKWMMHIQNPPAIKLCRKTLS